MNSPVRLFLHRRQALLFLIAILLPCAVLIALGIRTMDQERQLESKRLADEQQILLEGTRQALLSELEKVRLQEVTNAVSNTSPAVPVELERLVAFVAPIVDGQLRLPWENNPKAKQFRESLNKGDFATRVREGETSEAAARYENAIREYRAAINAAAPGMQQTYAHLLLARTLQNSGHSQEALAEYEHVVMSPPESVDEFGVPLGLYAAAPLLQAGRRQNEIVAWVNLAGDEERAFPPVALRLARDLAAKLEVPESASRLAEIIRDRELAEALQFDLPRIMPALQTQNPAWTPYGDPPSWLVTVGRTSESEEIAIAVRVNEALQHTSATGIRLAAVADTDARLLGDSFPGLRVMMPEPQLLKAGSRPTFVAGALVVALVSILLAGYLLWRDVQRELRLSEMRSQFVASVTHELKTPLTAIRMFTETIRLDEEVDQKTRNDYLDTILHESERLSRLVDNVLDFGKIERGKKTYRFQPVRLNEVVEQAARAAQYPLEQAGFALNLDTDQDLPPVQADPDALQQAVLNLLTNAMKYSGDSRSIALRLDRLNGHARIHVEDHGVGIAPEEQRRIFDRFYRAPTVENQHIPGTGLGLTIVDHIAKAHGGRVEVSSVPGDGSSFTICLPLGTN